MIVTREKSVLCFGDSNTWDIYRSLQVASIARNDGPEFRKNCYVSRIRSLKRVLMEGLQFSMNHSRRTKCMHHNTDHS